MGYWDMANTRRRMCFRGCTCDPCEAQRITDRRYSQARTTDPTQYPSQQSFARRARRMGLEADQLRVMQEQRNNRCDICGNPETVKGSTGKVKSLAIDHDHETGKIRGLLCNNCNRGIGLLGKEPGLLGQALEYLTRGSHD